MQKLYCLKVWFIINSNLFHDTSQIQRFRTGQDKVSLSFTKERPEYINKQPSCLFPARGTMLMGMPNEFVGVVLLSLCKVSGSVPLDWSLFLVYCSVCYPIREIGLTKRQNKPWPWKSIWPLRWTCPMSAALDCTANVFPSLSHGEQSHCSKAPAGQSSSTCTRFELSAHQVKHGLQHVTD